MIIHYIPGTSQMIGCFFDFLQITFVSTTTPIQRGRPWPAWFFGQIQGRGYDFCIFLSIIHTI